VRRTIFPSLTLTSLLDGDDDQNSMLTWNRHVTHIEESATYL